MRKILHSFVVALAALILWGCSSTRHVPDGRMLLDRVDIEMDDSLGLDRLEMTNYLRQQPNHKVLGFAKLQLGMYNLSGSDTTRWYNRWLRRLGQAPVIYDPDLTDASRRQLRQAMVNKGWLSADVIVDTLARPEKKKIEVRYIINPGKPHRIASIDYEIADRAATPSSCATAATTASPKNISPSWPTPPRAATTSTSRWCSASR